MFTREQLIPGTIVGANYRHGTGILWVLEILEEKPKSSYEVWFKTNIISSHEDARPPGNELVLAIDLIKEIYFTPTV